MDEFLQARKDQTLRQVAGFLRGVEQACRECANEGTRMLEEKLSFWRTWRLVWSREQWQQEFQTDVEAKLRQTVQPQVENAVQLLETDLRGLWPQLQDTIEAQFASGRQKPHAARRSPISRASVAICCNRFSSPSSSASRARASRNNWPGCFARRAAWLRLPAGVAAAGGIVTVIVAMSSAAVADVTGVARRFRRRHRNDRRLHAATENPGAPTREKWKRNALELVHAIEEQMKHAIDLFYKEISLAFAAAGRLLHELSANATSRSCERAEKLRETFARPDAARLGGEPSLAVPQPRN